MKRFLMSFLLTSAACAQTLSGTASVSGGGFLGTPTGTLPIALGSPTVTDTTIIEPFTSSLFTTSTLECTPTAGGAAEQAVDNNVITGVAHQQIVSGLTPSTAYTCQAGGTNGTTVTATFTATTNATPSQTAITGISFSTPTSVQTVGSCTADADTRYNAVSNDGNDYYIVDDTQGDRCSGVPPVGDSNMTISKWNSLTPPAGQTTNFLTGMGLAGAASTFDHFSAKAGSLFGMQGMLFLWASGQQNQCCGLPSSSTAYPETGGNLMMSPDHGATWNNFQKIGFFSPNGVPKTAAMLPSGGHTGTMGSCHFVRDGPDDGTL